MELKKRIYAYLMIDFIYMLIASTTLILKVHYYYSIIIPIYFVLTFLNWQILKSQSVGWLKTLQWLRILLLLIYGILFMTGVIMITTYHYGSWESLAQQAEMYYHVPERRLEIQLITGLSLFKFFIEVFICSHQNDQVEMLEFKKLYRMQ